MLNSKRKPSYQESYEKAKWTLVRGLIFLACLIVASLIGLGIIIKAPFPFMLIGVFYLIAGSLTSYLLGQILWEDYQKLVFVRSVITKSQKVTKTPS